MKFSDNLRRGAESTSFDGIDSNTANDPSREERWRRREIPGKSPVENRLACMYNTPTRCGRMFTIGIKVAYSPHAIANYFIDLAELDGKQLTPMQIQKLVFYAHGWHLAIKGEPLIDEQVEAWKFGPVIPSLYREFRHCGNQPVEDKATQWRSAGAEDWIEEGLELYAPSIDDQSEKAEFTRALLKRVWQQYGKFSAIQLSNMTHMPGTPWYQVFQQYAGNLPKRTDIPQAIIREYFVELGNRNR